MSSYELLYRVFIFCGVEFGGCLFPCFVELVDIFLVVVHVFGDGGDGIAVAAFRRGHKFCLEFAAQGFGLCDFCFKAREFFFERLDGVPVVYLFCRSRD